MSPVITRHLAAGVGVLALSLADAAAETTVDLDGEVRIRTETDDRSFQRNVSAEYFTLQRTRLRATAVTEAGARITVQLQDSRRWGNEGGTLDDTGNVDLHQGFIHLGSGRRVETFLGRQEIAYGAHRVIGNVGWSNVGRSFDAARVRVNGDGRWIDFAAARIHDAGPAVPNEYIVFAMGHASLREGNVLIEPFVIYRDVDPGAVARTSFGTHGRAHGGRVRILEDSVIQTGRASGMDQSAFLLAVDFSADVSPDADGSVGLSAGGSIYSGDDPSDDGDGPYDQLFPTGHKFYGLMDVVPGIAGSSGLVDLHLKGWRKTASGVEILGAVHRFRTDVERVLSGGSTGKDIGHEIDVTVRKPVAGMLLQIGGSAFFPDEVAEDAAGDENAFWGYAQGTARF